MLPRNYAIKTCLFCHVRHLISASALPVKHRDTEIASFHCKCDITGLPQFNQSPFHFFNLIDSRLILTLLYDSLVSDIAIFVLKRDVKLQLTN